MIETLEDRLRTQRVLLSPSANLCLYCSRAIHTAQHEQHISKSLDQSIVAQNPGSTLISESLLHLLSLKGWTCQANACHHVAIQPPPGLTGASQCRRAINVRICPRSGQPGGTWNQAQPSCPFFQPRSAGHSPENRQPACFSITCCEETAVARLA